MTLRPQGEIDIRHGTRNHVTTVMMFGLFSGPEQKSEVYSGGVQFPAETRRSTSAPAGRA